MFSPWLTVTKQNQKKDKLREFPKTPHLLYLIHFEKKVPIKFQATLSQAVYLLYIFTGWFLCEPQGYRKHKTLVSGSM